MFKTKFNFFRQTNIQNILIHWHKLKQKKSIKKIDINLFLRQFATLLTAGIPIIQTLEILQKSQTKQSLQLMIYEIKHELLSGKMLFNCFLLHKKYFDHLTCQLIRVGEHIGKLEMMLTIIADHHEKQYQFKQHLQQMLFYPCLITILAILMTISMFIFVIPKFADLFQSSSQPLPFLTLCIFYVAHLMQQFIFPLIIIFNLFFITFLNRQIREHVLSYFSKFTIRLPLLKSFIQKLILIRFSRYLSLMLKGGLSLTTSLQLVESITANASFAHPINQLQKQLANGITLYEAMEKNTFFPIFMIQMVRVGEECGQLDVMLNKVADFMERDIDQFLKQFNQLLEPLIMLVLGVLIGALVIGMYLPIFKLGTAI